MSNCVTISNKTYRQIMPKSFNKEKFIQFMDRAKSLICDKNCVDYNNGIDLEIMAWWYLAFNYEIENDQVVIKFGKGKSSHTDRDLHQTMHLLENFITENFKISLNVMDLENQEYGYYCEDFELKPIEKESCFYIK